MANDISIGIALCIIIGITNDMPNSIENGIANKYKLNQGTVAFLLFMYVPFKSKPTSVLILFTISGTTNEPTYMKKCNNIWNNQV